MNVLIKISTIIITLTIGVFLSSQLVLAQGSILTEEKKGEYNDTLNTFSQESNYPQNDNLETMIANAIKVILGVLGTIFIAMMFIAGNEWMQAAGNEEKIKKAKERIQSLIIGLVIIVLAYALSSGFSKLLVQGAALLK